ncbi:hypothetical protein, partial [uncultured Akkermansia sp.]|uniref:hypothetical protein n=1 Tax=uncultured Akkermansia sp. TaxID=512294 RepID=UPI002592F572
MPGCFSVHEKPGSVFLFFSFYSSCLFQAAESGYSGGNMELCQGWTVSASSDFVSFLREEIFVIY